MSFWSKCCALLVAVLFIPPAYSAVIPDSEFNKLKLINTDVPQEILTDVIKKLKTDSSIHDRVLQAAESKGVASINELKFSLISKNIENNQLAYKVKVSVYGHKALPEQTAMIYQLGEQYAYADIVQQQYAAGLIGKVIASPIIYVIDIILYDIIGLPEH